MSLIAFCILGFLPGITIGWDIVNYLFIYHYPPLLHVYTLPFMVILFMFLHIRDTVKSEVRLKLLYQKLNDLSREEVPEPKVYLEKPVEPEVLAEEIKKILA